ncbi:uncharacterized protein EDB91DRAFT_1256472 [Suillus paluster]|uniref:uncharacterized protein n=1 Tax=Suillus paluster TaxID=48578 RepID=UPI001B861915|nr:uncharacterized protein EDB91DRAFT_1256472 [Suillus paluster]KAG1721549.1 hypothetical protein EDB91DRAFT_1256472 [Suillus paluster]
MFEGDFFNTYEEGDLEWPVDKSDSSDDEQEEEGLHNNEWEPPIDDPIQGNKEPYDSNDSDLLEIDGVSEHLSLSYKNSKELNKIIDKSLHGRLKFKQEQIIVTGKAFNVFCRDAIECIKAFVLFACFVGNYPEQLLATGVKAMECPKCDIPTDELESNTTLFEMRDLHAVLDALATIDDIDLAKDAYRATNHKDEFMQMTQ